MNAWLVCVASTLSWIAGRLPASTSRWKPGGNVEREGVAAASIPVSTSCVPTSSGAMKSGGRSAATMAPESCERSSSTTATVALFSSIVTLAAL